MNIATVHTTVMTNRMNRARLQVNLAQTWENADTGVGTGPR